MKPWLTLLSRASSARSGYRKDELAMSTGVNLSKILGGPESDHLGHSLYTDKVGVGMAGNRITTFWTVRYRPWASLPKIVRCE